MNSSWKRHGRVHLTMLFSFDNLLIRSPIQINYRIQIASDINKQLKGRSFMKWFSGILLNALLFLFLSLMIPSFHVEHIGAAIIASFVLAIVNIIVRPLLILFTLPATILTLGFFLFVINAIMLLITNWLVGDGFIIDSFGTALLIALLMSLLNLILNSTVLKK